MGNRAKLPGMDDLKRLREEIGALDRSVLETLNRRLELVRRITRHKQETGTPLIDAERESELLRELADANAGPLSERAVQGVFAAVLDVMKQESRGETRPAEPVARPAKAAVGSLAVVGTGLLGASVALAAKRAGGRPGDRLGRRSGDAARGDGREGDRRLGRVARRGRAPAPSSWSSPCRSAPSSRRRGTFSPPSPPTRR